jgi:S-adenosylmethionine uptake transporter
MSRFSTSSPSTSSAIPFSMACAGIALFSLMDAYMKGLSIALGAYNAMFWRVLVGAGLTGVLFFIRRAAWPARAAMGLHIKRGCIASVMAVSFFYGIARVPLAEGIALSFIAPLLTLYLAAVLLGETISRNAIIASLLGIAGVGVMLAGRWGGSAYDGEAWRGIAAIFVSAIFYAYNLILQRQQAQIATPVEIAFFQSAVVTILLGIAAPFLAVVPDAALWGDIVISAVLAIISLLLLSWAYARAEAQVLVSVEYTAFLWAALFGWLFFREPVTLSTLGGTVLIITGCIIATRKAPAAQAKHGETSQI